MEWFLGVPWSQEQLPVDYSRIFALDKPKKTQKSALARAAKVDSREVVGGVAVGTYIRLHLEGVTRAAAGEKSRGQGEERVWLLGGGSWMGRSRKVQRSLFDACTWFIDIWSEARIRILTVLYPVWIRLSCRGSQAAASGGLRTSEP